MNILCISIDGLHNGMVGAWGNTWIRTLALDDLASRSVLFDRFYADSLRLETIFEAFWRSGIPTGFRSILLTDDDGVFHHASANFSEKHRLERPKADRPVAEVEETQFFQAFATVVDLLENGQRKADQPFFFWTHLQGFRGVWDFPMEYRQRYQGEEDPEPYAGVVPPELVAGPGETIDPDDLQAVMEAYAGGVSVMDDALAGLLDWFEESRWGEDAVLVFLSSRGFSLGEHHRIGADETLYGENLQLPLLIRLPAGVDPDAAATRCDALLTPGDLGDFLAAVDKEKSACDEFLAVFRGDRPLRNTLRIGDTDQERVLLTDEWFLRKTADRVELYVKPDDRWEVNDVADRCPEVVEELENQKKSV